MTLLALDVENIHVVGETCSNHQVYMRRVHKIPYGNVILYNVIERCCAHCDLSEYLFGADSTKANLETVIEEKSKRFKGQQIELVLNRAGDIWEIIKIVGKV